MPTAEDHRLLGTVVTESALLPDVAALYDVYHPGVTLYDVSMDRYYGGECKIAVHLGQKEVAVVSPILAAIGFHASTMLAEFAVLRGQMRRFSVVHLMCRMGFGACARYIHNTRSVYRR